MAYDKNIPQPSDLVSVSQSEILENFTKLDTIFGVDHTALETATNSGKHQTVTMPEQGSDPSTSVDEGALYTKDSGTQPELHYREESDGDIVQMTELGVVNTPVKAWASTDSSGTLEDGQNLSVSKTATGKYTYTFSGITMSNAYYAVIVTTVHPSTSGAPYVAERTADLFKVNFVGDVGHSLVVVGDIA